MCKDSQLVIETKSKIPLKRNPGLFFNKPGFSIEYYLILVFESES